MRPPRVNRLISTLAGLLTAVSIAIPPAAYLVFSYRYAEGSIETAAELSAQAINQIVTANPEMWRFEHVRLVELLSRRPSTGEAESRRILDDRGVVVAKTDVTVPAPRIKRALPLLDAGVVVGRVEITRSLRQTFVRAGLLTLALLPLGALIFLVLRTLPLRAIRRGEQALRASEERFLQSQKLESIGRLAGGVAHDFNNLLTIILSCCSALEQDLRSGSPASAEDVAEMKAAAERARDLTRQLLAFARRQVIAPVSLDLNVLVLRSQKLLARLLGEDVDLRVDAQDGLWPMECDPGQVEQVLLNLAVNARDAMPSGGRLVIETRNECIAAAKANPERRPAEWVRLVVRDSGVGMSPDVKAHLFEPFFTTKPQGSGTGLGLATVYGIVEQSGGHVHVESEPGRGATFEICFPRARLEPAPAATPAAFEVKGGTETVLVVEDDPKVREITSRALRSGGYRVLVAGAAGEALELAAREDGPLHMVITDVVMPGLDGRALAAELLRRRPELRVLFVSGYTQDVISHHGVLDSGVELLAKPFTAPALLARVREILDDR